MGNYNISFLIKCLGLASKDGLSRSRGLEASYLPARGVCQTAGQYATALAEVIENDSWLMLHIRADELQV